MNEFSIEKEMIRFIWGLSHALKCHQAFWKRDISVNDIDSFIAELVEIKIKFQSSEKQNKSPLDQGDRAHKTCPKQRHH